MKTIPLVLAAMLAAAVSVRSQETDAANSSETPIAPPVPFTIGTSSAVASIPGRLVDGTPSLPAPEPVLPDFKVKSEEVRQVDVVKPPPMSGLPPITGTITTTVQLVEDPGLPDPPPPVPRPTLSDSEKQARLAAFRTTRRNRQIVFLSATVYDRSRTFLRWHLNGRPDQVMAGWSNLDFIPFTGFSTFEVRNPDGEVWEYSLFMMPHEIDTRKTSARMRLRGRIYQVPEHPPLPDLATNGPALVVTEGDPADRNLVEVMEGINNLYRAEGTRMKEAYQARIEADKARRAEYLANPPKPEDVTIQVWKRDVPSSRNAGTDLRQGGLR